MRFLIGCSLLLLVSCGESKQEQWLSAARFISGSSSSQTLMYLDSIRYPHQLSAAQYAEYVLLRTEARDNLAENYLADTSALAATVAYYKKTSDAPHMLASLCYLGTAYSTLPARQEYAFFCFQEALEYVPRTEDYAVLFKLHLNMGLLYQKEYNRRQAAEHFNSAAEYSLQLSDRNLTASMLMRIGYCYFYLEQYDKSLAYFLRSRFMSGPGTPQDKEILLGICISYLRLDQLAEAKQVLLDAVNGARHPDYLAVENLSLAYIYYRQDKPDSAMLYLNSADQYRKNVQDIDFVQYYHTVLSKVYRQQGRYPEAIAELEEALHGAERKVTLMDDNSRSESYVKFQNEKYRRDSDKYRISLIATNVFFSVVLLALVVLWYLQRKRKNRLVQQIETSAVKLRSKLDSQEGQSRKLRKLIMRDWELAKRIALMQAQSSEQTAAFYERFDKMVRIGDQNPFTLDWPRFYSDVDDVFDQFAAKLRRQFPDLTEKEVQLCCLTRAGFKTDEIAFVWKQSVYSVHKSRSTIRKKLGMIEGEDIVAFLQKKMS